MLSAANAAHAGYVANDPLNYTDPTGKAKCGDTLDGSKDCETALDDADNARDQSKDAAEKILEIVDTKSSERTDEQKEIVELIKTKFGNKAGSSRNLRKIAKGLNGIADKIGKRGEGAVLQRGDDSTGYEAYVQMSFANGNRMTSRNTIYLNTPYFAGSNLRRESTLVHESGHLYLSGGHDWYVSGDGFKNRINEDNRSRKPVYDFYRNADSYACSIMIYSPVC